MSKQVHRHCYLLPPQWSEGDCLCTVSDALKFAVFLAHDIVALWTDPQFSAASVSSCNMGTFEAVVGEANETGLKLKPSKRIRPLSVPIQRYPSAVCAIPLTAPPGNLFSVVHSSRTYCDGRRLGSSARASLTGQQARCQQGSDRVGFNEQITEGTRTCRL